MALPRPPRVECFRLRPQEISLEDPHSRFMFQLQFVATRGVLDTFGIEVLLVLLDKLQAKARKHSGIDYLQVFENLEKGGTNLWFIEDGTVVTALLPSEY